jgi:hypothetical protein
MTFVLCFLLQRILRAGQVYVELCIQLHTAVGKLSKLISDGESCFIFTLWQVTPKTC